MTDILIADDDRQIVSMLEALFVRVGYKVHKAYDGQDALDKFSECKMPIVITDIEMPRMDGLTLLSRIKDINPVTSVIIITGRGTEEMAIKALRGGGTNYFKKPIDLFSLMEAVDRCRDLDILSGVEPIYQTILEKEEMNFVIPNDWGLLASAVKTIVSRCRVFFGANELASIRLGLDELLVNAVEHGNLEIDCDAKREMLKARTWDEFLSERLSQREYAERRVRISFTLNPEEMVCRIVDDGPGFNWEGWLSQLDKMSIFESNGRGIFVASLQFDEMNYSGRGNEVTLRKRCPEFREE